MKSETRTLISVAIVYYLLWNPSRPGPSCCVRLADLVFDPTPACSECCDCSTFIRRSLWKLFEPPRSAGLTSKPHRDQLVGTSTAKPYVDCFACDWLQLAQLRTTALNHGPSRTPVKRYLVLCSPNALGRAAAQATTSVQIPTCARARAASATVEPVVTTSSKRMCEAIAHVVPT